MRNDYTPKESRWAPFRGLGQWYVSPRSNRYYLGKRALRAACNPIPHFINALYDKRQVRRQERALALAMTPTIESLLRHDARFVVAQAEAATEKFFTERGISRELVASYGYQRTTVGLHVPPGQPVPVVLGYDKPVNAELFAPGDVIQFENMKDGQKVRCRVERCSGGSCVVRRLDAGEDHVGEPREQGPGEGA